MSTSPSSLFGRGFFSLSLSLSRLDGVGYSFPPLPCPPLAEATHSSHLSPGDALPSRGEWDLVAPFERREVAQPATHLSPLLRILNFSSKSCDISVLHGCMQLHEWNNEAPVMKIAE
uniref:Uncharacterized protein n=1 Tax=Triticum urartu TaxID=4572 RepID=A0A8R7R699_TRIUA